MQNTITAHEVVIRKGRPEDAKHFSRLVLFTGFDYFLHIFGPRVRSFMANLFKSKRNFFSYEHSEFIEVDGKVAGMTLGYDFRTSKKHDLWGPLLVVRYLKWDIFRKPLALLKAQNVLASIKEGDHYLSNIAIYPKFRGLGLGAKLLSSFEEKARLAGSKKIMLEVSTDNKKAISLYEGFGHSIQKRIPLFQGRKKFIEMFRMTKTLA